MGNDPPESSRDLCRGAVDSRVARSQRGFRRVAAEVTFSLVFIALTWPVIFFGRSGDLTNEAEDERIFHRPVIEGLAQQWPKLDIVNYYTSTTPGYYVMIALVHRFISDNLIALRLATNLLGLGLVLMAFRYAAREVGCRTAWFLVLPFLCSSYVLGASVWLSNHNVGLWFAVAALGGASLVPQGEAGLRRVGIWAMAAVLVRHVHVWIVGPIMAAAVLSSPLGRLVPTLSRRGADVETTWRPLACGLVASIAVTAVVGVFMFVWGGTTPPALQGTYRIGATPAMIPYTLALAGVYGLFYLPLVWPSQDDFRRVRRPLILLTLLGVTAALALPTAYSEPAGRWGGWLWKVVDRLPAIGDRSIAIPPLAALGSAVLVFLYHRAAAGGRAAAASILLLGLAGSTAAYSLNSYAFQRYTEPLILIVLAWLTALGVAPDAARGQPRARLLLPALLGFLQLALDAIMLYGPVLFGTRRL